MQFCSTIFPGEVINARAGKLVAYRPGLTGNLISNALPIIEGYLDILT
jgi:hypothetical protein